MAAGADSAKVDVSRYFQTMTDEFVRVDIPCAHFAEQGQNFRFIDTPFVLSTDGEAHFVMANMCWDVMG